MLEEPWRQHKQTNREKQTRENERITTKIANTGAAKGN
jgi:hypothetical protein